MQTTHDPTTVYQARFGSSPGAGSIESERKQWDQMCRELMAERDEARAQLQRTLRERDELRDSLYRLTHKDFEIDKDKVLSSLGQGPPLRQVIESLRNE
ncbi:MAG: hypothetical protein U0793_21620 [Gemmataceae bacterium]